MGTAKAGLEWHGSTLLHRTAGILSRVADGPVIVVRAPGQALPELPANVEVTQDPQEGLGPVQGLAAGLAAAAGRAEIAFVCSTDLPFLHPAFVRRVLRAVQDSAGGDSARDDTGEHRAGEHRAGEHGAGEHGAGEHRAGEHRAGEHRAGEHRAGEHGVDVALPVARGYPQPLAAAYRTVLAPVAARLVAEGRLRPAFLFDECAVTRLDEAALRADPVLAALDPDLDSVLNVNEPGDYQAARARPAPPITIQRFGTLADGHRGPEPARAATVAGAAAAAGLTLGRHVVAALNGDQITRDGQTPLAAGDTVFFLAADAGG